MHFAYFNVFQCFKLKDTISDVAASRDETERNCLTSVVLFKLHLGFPTSQIMCSGTPLGRKTDSLLFCYDLAGYFNLVGLCCKNVKTRICIHIAPLIFHQTQQAYMSRNSGCKGSGLETKQKQEEPKPKTAVNVALCNKPYH